MVTIYEGYPLGLKFSGEKSGILVYNDEKGDTLKIQDILIEHVEKYNYLGVWLNEGKLLKRGGRIYDKERKKECSNYEAWGTMELQSI